MTSPAATVSFPFTVARASAFERQFGVVVVGHCAAPDCHFTASGMAHEEPVALGIAFQEHASECPVSH